MKYSNIPAAQAVVYHCKARGIENIVISPGSRNAPLTLGFTSDPYFKCYSIVDERSAAFFALGIAQQMRKPVVLLCTSGSALLNYYPAVAEAFYSDIPLVVISADRPSYKIDIGDGQTIRQDHVFDRHIGFTALLKQDITHATQELTFWGVLADPEAREHIEELQLEVQAFNDSELNQAFEVANENNAPVHINVPLEEPLYGMLNEELYLPVVRINNSKETTATPDVEDLIKLWNSSKRKLIIIGVQHPGELGQEVLDQWAEDPSVVVLTETTSNLAHPNFINNIDSVVAPIELAKDNADIFDKLRPEILITLGGLLVSKKIKAFLRLWKPDQHWQVHEKKAYNTFNALTKHIKHAPGDFFCAFLPHAKPVRSEFQANWDRVNTRQKELRTDYLDRIPFSDMSAFDLIFRAIPKNYQLQLANSSTVRYSQLFEMDPDWSVFCNRGTSGIDGSTSTAVGAAVYFNGPTVLVSGDLSFLYDLNALWNDYIRDDFRIIVINNGGGGIFRILPGGQKDENFERFFETSHQFQFENICNNFGFRYLLATDKNSLQQALASFFEPEYGATLLEIKTPRKINDKVLLEYFEFLSSKIYS